MDKGWVMAETRQSVCAIIEARMGSSRLPGKVMLDIAGQPMLARMVERVRRARLVDTVVVATTARPADDIIEALCRRLRCPCFRGSENDMLDRLLGSARAFGGDVIVQLTGDCPAVDHRHIDRSVEFFRSGEFDYVCNNMPQTLPIGFDVRLFPTEVLARAGEMTADPIDRVHGSYYIYTHPERFRLGSWGVEQDMCPKLRLTVDEYLDYSLMQQVFEALLPEDEDFSAEDVVRFLRERPELGLLNAAVRQKTAQEG
jgi:spore coat polysaccharide biosynthesis protein SpsF